MMGTMGYGSANNKRRSFSIDAEKTTAQLEKAEVANLSSTTINIDGEDVYFELHIIKNAATIPMSVPMTFKRISNTVPNRPGTRV